MQFVKIFETLKGKMSFIATCHCLPLKHFAACVFHLVFIPSVCLGIPFLPFQLQFCAVAVSDDPSECEDPAADTAVVSPGSVCVCRVCVSQDELKLGCGPPCHNRNAAGELESA